MKKAQLNAISYSYSKKAEKERNEKAKQLNLLIAFENQKTFKTLNNFLKAYDKKSEKFKQAITQAIKNIDIKIKCVKNNNNITLANDLAKYNEFLKNI